MRAAKTSRAPLLGSLFVIIIVASIFLALFFRQTIVDHIVAWQYQPSSVIESFVSESGMNDHGKLLYYASQPQLEDKSSFGKYCPSSESGSAVLGCYVNDRIYLFNVTNDQLKGIKPVTAAHEMLHAAYQRLSTSEKKRVDAMLEENYQRVKDQADLETVMETYKKSEPGEADNELHSLLGTEIKDLSPGLEAYYERYFSDRQKVVSAFTTYHKVFEALNQRADKLAAQLSALKTQIETSSAAYSSDTTKINQDIATFNNQAKNGGFASQSDFLAQRAELISRVDALQAQRDQINADIARYNSLATDYNEIATESRQLNDSLNSNLPAAPQV